MNLLAWQQGQAGGSIIGSAGGENATTNTAQDEKKDADESPTTLFLTVTLSQRLGIFTPAGFQEYQRRLDNLPPLDADTETILAQVDGLTYKMPVDKQFRVRLPIELCQATGLEKGQQVTVVGRRSYLEVWDKALWEKSSREAIKTFPQLLKNLRSS